MHLLRLFMAVWIEFGIVTVFFLYWLVTRTAKRVNTLDELLSAAYTLQEKNRSLVKETKAESSQTVSLRPEPVQMTHSDLEPLASLTHSAVPNSRDRRIPRS